MAALTALTGSAALTAPSLFAMVTEQESARPQTARARVEPVEPAAGSPLRVPDQDARGACGVYQKLTGVLCCTGEPGGGQQHMARDYDSQLLESVAVRRRRMRDALLFGAGRARRTADERLGKVFAGMAIAAVLCAGCVGWSFIQTTLAKQKAEQQQQQRQQQGLQQQGFVRPYGRLSVVPGSSQPPALPKTVPEVPSQVLSGALFTTYPETRSPVGSATAPQSRPLSSAHAPSPSYAMETKPSKPTHP